MAVMESSSLSWLIDERENLTIVDKSVAFLRKHMVRGSYSAL